MGSTSRACLVILRVWEIICSVIVLGLVAHFVKIIADAGGENDGRIIYTLIVASISTLFAILFVLPFLYAFLAFPFDFILFVAWLTAFGLLAARTGTRWCNSVWYYNYWGYYWGGWWNNPSIVGGPGDIAWTGCAQWRTVLAFSFLAALGYLISFILGVIVVVKHYGVGKKNRTAATPSAPMMQSTQPQTGATGPPATAPVNV